MCCTQLQRLWLRCMWWGCRAVEFNGHDNAGRRARARAPRGPSGAPAASSESWSAPNSASTSPAPPARAPVSQEAVAERAAAGLISLMRAQAPAAMAGRARSTPAALAPAYQTRTRFQRSNADACASLRSHRAARRTGQHPPLLHQLAPETQSLADCQGLCGPRCAATAAAACSATITAPLQHWAQLEPEASEPSSPSASLGPPRPPAPRARPPPPARAPRLRPRPPRPPGSRGLTERRGLRAGLASPSSPSARRLRTRPSRTSVLYTCAGLGIRPFPFPALADAARRPHG